ncbi:hypothetical protein HOLleu_16127 [Holothuria leucospilota]|uniref:Uncharacterized protein n=1 Tax=Holothuria leucospilota TaxID=206669 RepID=A0A9Q1C5V7_HOLLE|nr:hypothetical protein HOLleu_16127 [Holothuria leucospilota]
MKNFAVICFLVAVTAVLFVQRISGDDGFWYGEELHDVEKRQNWDAFYNKHVVEAPSTIKDDKYWNKIAKKRLGSGYGKRTFNTFNRVSDKTLILTAFYLQHKCSNGYSKSDRKFDLVEMTWNAASDKYSVKYPGQWYICVTLDKNNQPIHFHGKE